MYSLGTSVSSIDQREPIASWMAAKERAEREGGSRLKPLLGRSQQCWATLRAYWTLVCGAPPPVPLALDASILRTEDPGPVPRNGKTNGDGVAKPGTQSRAAGLCPSPVKSALRRVRYRRRKTRWEEKGGAQLGRQSLLISRCPFRRDCSATLSMENETPASRCALFVPSNVMNTSKRQEKKVSSVSSPTSTNEDAYGISGKTRGFTAAPFADNPLTDSCRPPTCAALRSEIDRGMGILNPCTPSIPIAPFALPWPNTVLHISGHVIPLLLPPFSFSPHSLLSPRVTPPASPTPSATLLPHRAASWPDCSNNVFDVNICKPKGDVDVSDTDHPRPSHPSTQRDAQRADATLRSEIAGLRSERAAREEAYQRIRGEADLVQSLESDLHCTLRTPSLPRSRPRPRIVVARPIGRQYPSTGTSPELPRYGHGEDLPHTRLRAHLPHRLACVHARRTRLSRTKPRPALCPHALLHNPATPTKSATSTSASTSTRPPTRLARFAGTHSSPPKTPSPTDANAWEAERKATAERERAEYLEHKLQQGFLDVPERCPVLRPLLDLQLMHLRCSASALQSRVSDVSTRGPVVPTTSAMPSAPTPPSDRVAYDRIEGGRHGPRAALNLPRTRQLAHLVPLGLHCPKSNVFGARPGQSARGASLGLVLPSPSPSIELGSHLFKRANGLDKTKPLAFVLPTFPTGVEMAEVVVAGAGLATIGIEGTAGGNTGCPKLGSGAGRTAGGRENVDVVAGALLLVEGRDKVLAHAEEDAEEELAAVFYSEQQNAVIKYLPHVTIASMAKKYNTAEQTFHDWIKAF
ncbi:hypothetical protein B0H14DRAFT_3456080 [Mycena olivaceomarginata]|nr:hypothetical protein B0H14DRAFT_3456080 [Mycena olivaceomarginata]